LASLIIFIVSFTDAAKPITNNIIIRNGSVPSLLSSQRPRKKPINGPVANNIGIVPKRPNWRSSLLFFAFFGLRDSGINPTSHQFNSLNIEISADLSSGNIKKL
jgi:hypothetical protein